MSPHLKPHQAAGAVLRARQNSNGICHLRSTPRITATRGWRTDCLESSADADTDAEAEGEAGAVVMELGSDWGGEAREVRFTACAAALQAPRELEIFEEMVRTILGGFW